MTNTPETHVSSAANPAVRLARALIERRRVRYREQAFLAEGERVLATLLDGGVTPRVVFVDAARRAELSPPTLERLSVAADRVLVVEPELYRTLTDTDTPQAVCAILSMPARVKVRAATLALALDGVRDPGNLGTILRSAVAAGVDAIALLPGTADPFGPKAVRASAGLVGIAPLVRVDAISELISESFGNVPAVVLADADAEQSYDLIDWSRPSCLVVGGEVGGFAPPSVSAATEHVRIPMHSNVESLNAGVAAAVILFEATRQRRRSRV